MACHPKLTVARVKAHRRSLCELWWASFACIRERRMERETGIEPATNSLEGCDSTTELLPPPRRSLRPPAVTAGKLDHALAARYLALRRASPPFFLQPTRRFQPAALTPVTLLRASSARPTFMCAPAQRKVGGEGRVRTSVARRRQIYSLLRLTTPPPPRNTSRADLQGTTALDLSTCIL
jgi:hypothetical protein